MLQRQWKSTNPLATWNHGAVPSFQFFVRDLVLNFNPKVILQLRDPRLDVDDFSVENDSSLYLKGIIHLSSVVEP